MTDTMKTLEALAEARAKNQKLAARNAELVAEVERARLGHRLQENREDGLGYCTRCKGGEIELDEPCLDRMERRCQKIKDGGIEMVEGLSAALSQRDTDLARLTTENAKLREVVAKLPKTADGVPASLGMKVWYVYPTRIATYELSGFNTNGDVFFQDGFSACWDWSRAYSTEAVALAALEAVRAGGGTA